MSVCRPVQALEADEHVDGGAETVPLVVEIVQLKKNSVDSSMAALAQEFTLALFFETFFLHGKI